MSLESFLHNLHAGSSGSGPPDPVVDWEDAPLKYKLYRGLPDVPLSLEVPLTLTRRNTPAPPELTSVGHMLWYMCGLTQWSHWCDFHSKRQNQHPMQMHRRFAPSGGGLYPNEIYVYLKIKEAPYGIYHYDAAHHRLILLREGDFDFFLSRALGNRCNVSACFGTLFVSTVFWKNYYKYNNFAYRLQGLDAGALIGQSLEVANRFGYASGVCFQFLDRAVNHLLGLSDQEESVYAIIPLSTEPVSTWFTDTNGGTGDIRAVDLCRELEVVRHIHFERSRHKKPFPMLIRMNEASMIESSGDFRQLRTLAYSDSGIRLSYLPRVKSQIHDLAALCRKRYSPETEFVLSRVTGTQIGGLLQEAAASSPYINDLDGPHGNPVPRVLLYGCMYNVEGIPDGAYRYDPAAHTLRRISGGDHRQRLQSGMYLHNVNLSQVPLCLHVAGNKDFLKPELGYRGYRIQQMEAGILVQRTLLAASARGMGGRPLLGFQSSVSDEIYNLASQGITSLIQLPVGSYRHSSRLEGSLHT